MRGRLWDVSPCGTTAGLVMVVADLVGVSVSCVADLMRPLVGTASFAPGSEDSALESSAVPLCKEALRLRAAGILIFRSLQHARTEVKFHMRSAV